MSLLSGTEAFGLGALQAEHGRSFRDAVLPPLVALLVPGAAAVLLVLASRYVPPTERETFEKAWFLFLVAPLASLFILWRWWRNRGVGAQVFEQGLVVADRSGVQACRWDQVSALWASRFEGGAPAYGQQPQKGYTVVRHDGVKLELPPALARLERLADRLHSETLRWMLPWALSQLQAGAMVPFGPYTVGSRGLTVAAPSYSLATMVLTGGAAGIGSSNELTTVPWNAFSAVRFESRWIRLKRPGLQTDWYIVRSSVPNVHVLEALLLQLGPRSA